jgi:ligand-binding sensor domain-containing protein
VALALDPADPPTLYAGTERRGLFRSTDGGERWQPWGLDGSSVYAILQRRSGSIWLATDQGIFHE